MNIQKIQDPKDHKYLKIDSPSSSKNVKFIKKEEYKNSSSNSNTTSKLNSIMGKSTKVISRSKIIISSSTSDNEQNGFKNKKIKKSKISYKQWNIYLTYYRKIIYKKKITNNYYDPYLKIDYLRLYSETDVKYMKDEDKPLVFHYYKTNKILKKIKSRLFINYYDLKIYDDENEYLSNYFRINESRIIFRFLVNCLYCGDIYTISNKIDKYIIIEKVIDKYNTYIDEHLYLINDRIKNKPKIINFMSHYVDFDKEIVKLVPNKIIDEQINKKMIYHDDLSFLSGVKYIYLKDLPHEKIPNCIPNFFINGNEILKIVKNYFILKKFSKNVTSFDKFISDFKYFKKIIMNPKETENIRQINNKKFDYINS